MAEKQKNDEECCHFRLNSGEPVSDNLTSLKVGVNGPPLMGDVPLLEKLAHMNRERIPERVVHAVGTGAHGYFEVTKDVTGFCKAKFLKEIGLKTDVFVRFSLVVPDKGFSEATRDTRGFSIKFYTEDGNLDLVCNDFPVFFIRDPIKFPDLIHSQKRNPKTNLFDPNTYWDFLSLTPESIHHTMMFWSDRGIPKNFRTMDGFGIHTFKWVNSEGKIHWVKFHFKTQTGIDTLTLKEAEEVLSQDPNHATRDLYNAIAKGETPTWKLFVQIMPEEDAAKYKWDILDTTKVWLHKDYPLQEVGKLVLNRNVENFFAETEQSAFCPSRLVPGIEPSPDPMLQARMFAYADTQRYRLGVNFEQIPINCPYALKSSKGILNESRDGLMTVRPVSGNVPNYFPNSMGSNPQINTFAQETPYKITGIVSRHVIQVTDDDFVQPRLLWNNVFDDIQRAHFVENVCSNLGKVDMVEIQNRTIQFFAQVDEKLAQNIAKGIGINYNGLKRTLSSSSASLNVKNEEKSKDTEVIKTTEKTTFKIEPSLMSKHSSKGMNLESKSPETQKTSVTSTTVE